MKDSLTSFLLAPIVLLSMMVACSPKEEPVGPNNNNNNQKEDPKVEVSSVSLDKTAATLAIEESIDLTATVSPSNATDNNVTWSTSDNNVATVSNGKVTAKKEGTVTITVTAGGKTATCTITVKKGGFPEGKLPADNEIWYITSDNKPIKEANNMGSVNLLSNEYSGGMGVLKYSGPITTFGNLAESDDCRRVTGLLIPDCVEVIDTWAFHYKFGIKEFRIPSSFRISQGGFLSYWGSDLERFTGHHVSEDGRCVIIDGTLIGFAPAGISSYEIPTGVVKIDGGSFTYARDLKSVVIPSSVEVIDDSAFAESGLESVTIPASVKSMHHYSFMGCKNLKNLLGDSPFISADRKFLYEEGNPLQPMVLFFFAGRDDTSYEIPEGIQTIEFYSFMDCDKLKSLTFPKSLSTIEGSNAFQGCVNLEALYGSHTTADHKGFVTDDHELQFLIPNISDDYVVPDDVTSLGWEVLAYRQTLHSVTMGDQVTSIGHYAFAGCPELKTVTLSANIVTFGYNPFWNSIALEAVYFRGVIPPVIEGIDYTESPNLKMYVPSQSLKIYTSDAGWKDYWKFMEPYEYGDLPKPDFYISSDYSKEGEVTVYQKAKKGNGIDVVFMGDAYSDREVASGKYLKDMKASVESFFSIEPYKSFRDLFNIYFVTTVSATEHYEHGGRSLGTIMDGLAISGNDSKCLELSLKAVGDEARMDEVLIVVCGNQDLSGQIRLCGTCFFYDPSDWKGSDYASGPSVTYFLKVDEAFNATADVLHHESGGHGFAKLADEYFYTGSVESRVTDYINSHVPYRWFSNIDLTSDPSKVKWSAFLNDGRYKNEGLGIFEGGYTYQYGVWRPTMESIMGNSGDSFNAPSRYAIWYRIHKLAYGKDWNGTYEDFVAYDKINRKSSQASGVGTRASVANSRGQKTPPPVITGRTWKEAVRER